MDQKLNLKYPALFKDAQINLQLENKGYIVFPLLPQSAVAQLLEFFHTHEKSEPQHFYSSTHSSDFEFRKRCSAFMKQVVEPFLPAILDHYKVLGGAFVVKPANGKGILQPHQDWNLVDETLTRSFNLWIPLVDVNEQNGAVYVLEGSHHAFQAYRGPGINSTLKDVEERIWKKMHALNMKAGEALLYDHALVHGSPPNQTAKVRTGIVLGILPETAEMKLYTTGTRGIEVYECNEDFFLSHQPSDAHKKLRHLQTIDTHQTNVPEEYFASHYPEAEVAPTEQKKPNLFRKLLSKLVS